jgi:hypothetical protein
VSRHQLQGCFKEVAAAYSDRILLTRLIPLQSGIENLTLGLGEQEIAFLHADGQIFGGVFVGHFLEIYRPSITFSIK